MRFLSSGIIKFIPHRCKSHTSVAELLKVTIAALSLYYMAEIKFFTAVFANSNVVPLILPETSITKVTSK